MARNSDDIYDSDWSMEAVGIIRERLIRDMIFWVSPEVISQTPGWLRQILTIVELFLILDEIHGISICEEAQLNRWQTLFFNVWDAEWDAEEAVDPYRTYAYRVQYRDL